MRTDRSDECLECGADGINLRRGQQGDNHWRCTVCGAEQWGQA